MRQDLEGHDFDSVIQTSILATVPNYHARKAEQQYIRLLCSLAPTGYNDVYIDKTKYYKYKC